MIPFDFEYYRPESIPEAISLYHDLDSMKKKPLYYGGGTEFISMARMNNIYSKALIDIKSIPELNTYHIHENELIIGSALTLTQIAEKNLYPLLSLMVKRIADHTIQGKITLGGNIAGTIIYKESLLALMIANAQVLISSKDSTLRLPVYQVFNKELNLNKGDLITQIIIDTKYINLPSIHVKRTKNDKIDYPLISIAAVKNHDTLRFAFSGLGDYPFRSAEFEAIINNSDLDIEIRIKKAIDIIKDKIVDSLSGSREYKKFMLHNMLYEAIGELEEVK